MQRGLLPGAIALSSKFLPALRKVTAQTIDSTRRFLQEAPEGAGGAARPARGASDGGEAAAGAPPPARRRRPVRPRLAPPLLRPQLPGPCQTGRRMGLTQAAASARAAPGRAAAAGR